MDKKKILVVDDEAMIVNLCRRILEGEGYEVHCAISGEEAVKIVSPGPFHMLVSDLLMPGMDGLKTFLALREKYPDLIGILITGHGTIDTALDAMGLGFSGFIRKPFPALELKQVVREAFHKSELAYENTRLRTLIPLYSLGEKFISAASKDEVLSGLIETLSQQTGAGRISIMLYEDKERFLRIVAAEGLKKEIIDRARIRPGEGIAGKVFQDGKPVILNGGPDDNSAYSSFMKLKNITAAVSFPLKSRDHVLGVVNISKTGTGTPFSPADVEMISVICGQAVMALENLKIMDEKAEKIRVRTLLEQYLAPEVAERIISSGEDLLEVGEIRTVAILFADIRNFTPLVREIPLKTIRSFLNDFFGLFSEVIFKFQGTMDKFMGDAALAFFGAPVSISNPEMAALDSAVLVNNTFGELREAWASENEALGRIGLGIGVSSGEVFLGNVGSKRRLDYTVIGPDVNIAQRLSSEAASGEILLTETVKQRLDGRFQIRGQSERLLKGLDRPVKVYSIIAAPHLSGVDL